MQNTKTRTVAVYPDGRRIPIVRSGRWWQYDRGMSSESKRNATIQAIEGGAQIIDEPNPNYRPARPIIRL